MVFNAGFSVRVKDLVLVITVYIIADHVRSILVNYGGLIWEPLKPFPNGL